MTISLSSSSKTAHSRRSGPKGLWHARAASARNSGKAKTPQSSDTDHDHDHDGSDDFASVSSYESPSRAPKRRRRPSNASSASSDLSEDDVIQWTFAQRQLCALEHVHQIPQPQHGWTRRRRIMDTTSVAFAGAETETKTVCDLEDWFDLKDLFAKAAEQYENHSALEALPYIRGVVHECHSFLNLYQDPSVLFIGQRHDEIPHDLYDWDGAHRPKCTCIELPTAFHSILGTALFMFGNLIDKDATLALPGEPATPIPYWLGALDVFETGENLPSRVYGTGCDAPEDWRMAIIWGRTLVAIADANVSQGSGEDCSAIFTLDEPNWPSESPFAAIALRRPPLTRRMTLASASSNDIMVLAMDQFSRGIFHMPQFSPGATSTLAQPFSRANELFNIASEVLALAQKMRSPTEQVFWALWADSVLNQMKMEGADGEHWRGIINRSRAECWLIAGSVHAEHIENQMEEGDSTVLETAMARQARTSLEKSIGFFEKSGVEEIAMAEALLSLANITPEGSAKEALYRRVELLGIDLESMDVD